MKGATMDFIPEQPKRSMDVPFYDDVTANGGWRGHTTGKRLITLQSEITEAVTRLGGMVTGFQRGSYQTEHHKREGFRIHYVLERPDGTLWPGQLDIAALPVHNDYRKRRSLDTRRERSLKMSLYMLREALEGLWFLQQLSPGYAGLLPWMLEERSGRTFTQLWTEQPVFDNLLPPPDADFVEGELKEIFD